MDPSCIAFCCTEKTACSRLTLNTVRAEAELRPCKRRYLALIPLLGMTNNHCSGLLPCLAFKSWKCFSVPSEVQITPPLL